MIEIDKNPQLKQLSYIPGYDYVSQVNSTFSEFKIKIPKGSDGYEWISDGINKIGFIGYSDNPYSRNIFVTRVTPKLFVKHPQFLICNDSGFESTSIYLIDLRKKDTRMFFEFFPWEPLTDDTENLSSLIFTLGEVTSDILMPEDGIVEGRVSEAKFWQQYNKWIRRK